MSPDLITVILLVVFFLIGFFLGYRSGVYAAVKEVEKYL